MKCDWCPPKFSSKFPPSFQRCPGYSSKTNPGNILGLHYMANRIRPIFLDGIELDYNHRLTPNKTITAKWILSHNMPSGFRFGGIYTARLTENVMQTPTIRADINPSTLSTNVGLIYYPFRCLRMEAELQRSTDGSALQTQSCIELCTNSSTLTANLYNVRRDNGRGTLSFLRSVTDHLALGAELLLEWTEPNSIMTDTAFAARYRHHNYAVAATASRQGVDVSYWQRIHPRLQMASFWAWQRKTEKSVATISYQWDFPEAYVRGMFDSNLSVGVLYSRAISHIPVNVALSLLINLQSNRFIFGLKFLLDPSGLRRENGMPTIGSAQADYWKMQADYWQIRCFLQKALISQI